MISSSYMHHGRRVKLYVAFDDTGPESWKAAQEELDAMLRQRKQAAAKVVSQSFRKKKAPKREA